MTFENEIEIDPGPRVDAVESSRPAAAADPYESFLRNKNFGSLNGVRFLCCMAVIKFHVHWDFPSPRLFWLGNLGVDLFFCISGFLIVTLLIRERGRRGTISLARFYARRSLRIFPIYYMLILAVFAFYLAISPWKPNGLDFYFWGLVALLTYTQDIFIVRLGPFNPCWSLAMEEQFYLFWPTIEKFASRTARWCILGGLLVVNQAVNFGVFDGLIRRIYDNPAATSQPIYIITFTPILLGVLLAYLLDDRRAFAAMYRVVGHRWSPFLGLGLLFAACELMPEMGRGWPRLAVYLIFMLTLASLVIREDHYARPILASRPFDHLGAISYGIYLYHSWVICLLDVVRGRLHPAPIDRAAEFVLVSLGTFAVAELSYRFVEQPFLRIKQRYHS